MKDDSVTEREAAENDRRLKIEMLRLAIDLLASGAELSDNVLWGALQRMSPGPTTTEHEPKQRLTRIFLWICRSDELHGCRHEDPDDKLAHMLRLLERLTSA